MKVVWHFNKERIITADEAVKLKAFFNNKFEKAYFNNTINNNGDLNLVVVIQWTGPHDYCEFEIQKNSSHLTLRRPPKFPDTAQRLKESLKEAGYT